MSKNASISILLIEDDEGTAFLTKEALEKQECEVQIASTGTQGLKKLASGDFKVALLDHNLPDMKSTEFLEKLKQKNVDIPVILVTGGGNENVAVEAMKRGAYDYIVKATDLSHFQILPLVIERSIQRYESNKEKERLQKQLSQTEKLRALGEMAHGVAHDFNNILASILGRAQLLQLKTEDQTLLKSLREIENAAISGADTVKRIQEFTRIRTDQNFDFVDIDKIVDDAIEITKPQWKDQAQAKGVTIEIKREKDRRKIPPFPGDFSALKEALTNILQNAIDALPQGGQVIIKTKTDREKIFVSITDNGAGISDEVKEKIFQPYFTTKGVERSGLGLSVAYGIMKRHKGDIEVQSKPGQGSTFTLIIPLECSTKKECKKEKKVSQQKPANILVIEDEQAVREVIVEILELENHKVTQADGGNQGIEFFKKGKFDIVITDLGMPNISGWEVAKTIKGIDPEAVVIMVTGWGAQFDEKKLKENKVDHIVAKPIKMNHLMNLVSELMKSKKEKLKITS
jgi:signal transduction histidine kinase